MLENVSIMAGVVATPVILVLQTLSQKQKQKCISYVHYLLYNSCVCTLNFSMHYG